MTFQPYGQKDTTAVAMVTFSQTYKLGIYLTLVMFAFYTSEKRKKKQTKKTQKKKNKTKKMIKQFKTLN